jgi:hypothetical protein
MADANTFGGMPTASDAAGLAALLKEMAGSLGTIKEGFFGVEKKTADATKRLSSYGHELKSLLAYTEDLEEVAKGYLDIQKKLSKDTIKADSYEDVLSNLKEMHRQSDTLVKSGIFSGKTLDAIKYKMKAVEEAIDDVGAVVGTAFDGDKVRPLIDGIGKIHGQIEKLAKTAKEVTFSTWSKDVHSAEKAVMSLLGKASRMDKFSKFGQMGFDIKKAHEARHKGRAEEFHARRNALIAKHSPQTAAGYRTVAQEAHGGIFGGGPIAAALIRKQEVARASGKPMSRLAAVGTRMMEMGEGSVGRGLISGVSGAIEGGSAGVMGSIAAAAPILAILDVIKEAFDKRVMMNSQVNDALGKGGIYAGAGVNPIDQMKSINSNLNTTPWRGFRFGVGYDKNLSLAKTMVEQGFGADNLGSGLNQDDDKDGFKRSSFGSIQRNAYVFGRVAGMNPDQTTEQTLKLVTQYRQSLKSTEDFFINITKDSKAAGISVTKYVSIIDEVNSGYDRMNKLLAGTVDIMRLMSRTGRLTAEDMKDMVDTATNGGQRAPYETQAYLNIESMRRPGGMAPRLRAERSEYEAALDNAASALGAGKSAEEVAKIRSALANGIEQPGNRGGAAYLSGMQLQADKQFSGENGDPLAHQAASGALSKLGNSYQQMLSTQLAVKNNDGLGLATSDQIMGNTFTKDTFGTLQSVQQAMMLSGYNSTDLFDSRKRAAMYQDPKFKFSMEALGVDPKKMNGLPQILQNVAPTAVDMFKQGNNATDDDATRLSKQTFASQAREYLTGQGVTGIDMKDPDAMNAMQKFTKGAGNDVIVASLLPGMKQMLEQMVPGGVLEKSVREIASTLDEAQSKASTEKIKSDTTPMAEIFKTAFTSLFLMLSRPLEVIAKVLSSHFGDANATPEQAKQFRSLMGSGRAAKADAMATSQIAYKQSEIEKYKASHKDATVDNDPTLAAMQKDMDSLSGDQTVLQRAMDGSTKGLPLLADDVGTSLGLISREVTAGPSTSGVSNRWLRRLANNLMGDAMTLSPALSGVVVDGTSPTASPAGGGTTVVTNITNVGVDVGKQPLRVQSGLRPATDAGQTTPIPTLAAK